MAALECPGLPASWLNAWLAAVGTTVLVPDLRLSWTDGPAPHAVLHSEEGRDPVGAVVEAWPTAERVDDMPIARDWRDCGEMRRQPPVRAFRERAAVGRGHPDIWTLSSTLTDLFVSESNSDKATVRHSRLDPAAPGPAGTLHDRLQSTLSCITDPDNQIRAALAGRAVRSPVNGLGFDVTRITALGDGSGNRVDAVVEALTFFGLALLPNRGDGACGDWRGIAERVALRQRAWHLTAPNSPRRMIWPAWSPRLTRWGIDALLDAWRPVSRGSWPRFGVHAAWASVEYSPRATADTTRGIGSEAF